jgi:hypothetical protein
VIVDLKKKSIAPIVSNLAGRGEFITLRFDNLDWVLRAGSTRKKGDKKVVVYLGLPRSYIATQISYHVQHHINSVPVLRPALLAAYQNFEPTLEQSSKLPASQCVCPYKTASPYPTTIATLET